MQETPGWSGFSLCDKFVVCSALLFTIKSHRCCCVLITMVAHFGFCSQHTTKSTFSSKRFSSAVNTRFSFGEQSIWGEQSFWGEYTREFPINRVGAKPRTIQTTLYLQCRDLHNSKNMTRWHSNICFFLCGLECVCMTSLLFSTIVARGGQTETG